MRLGDLVARAHERIERKPRLLRENTEFMAPEPLKLLRTGGIKNAFAHDNLTIGHQRWRKRAHDGLCHQAFARSYLAQDDQWFTGIETQRQRR